MFLGSFESLNKIEKMIFWSHCGHIFLNRDTTVNGCGLLNFKNVLLLLLLLATIWGHSKTTWTRFSPFLTTHPPYVDNCGHIIHHLPMSMWTFMNPPTLNLPQIFFHDLDLKGPKTDILGGWARSKMWIFRVVFG